MTNPETTPQTIQGATDDLSHRHGSSCANDLQFHQGSGGRILRSREGIRDAGTDAGRTESEVHPSPDAQGIASIPHSGGVDPLHYLNTLPGPQVERLFESRPHPFRHVPRVVVSSPAYQMPEIPSDADVFADAQIRKYALDQWMRDHLVRAYNVGHSDGQTAKIGYVVGYTSLVDRLPDFTRAAFDGRIDAERFAQEQNDRFKMLKHKVYELHEVSA